MKHLQQNPRHLCWYRERPCSDVESASPNCHTLKAAGKGLEESYRRSTALEEAGLLRAALQ